MKPVKYAVSYVIYDADRSHLLTVRRPADDPDLPDVWGLPAGSVRLDEAFEEALIRSGKEKLGVDLRPVKFIGRGNIERPDYILHMEEYEAEIVKGEPRVPQPTEGVTQYRAWRWGVGDDLKEAGKKGSLCCQLYLSSKNEQG